MRGLPADSAAKIVYNNYNEIFQKDFVPDLLCLPSQIHFLPFTPLCAWKDCKNLIPLLSECFQLDSASRKYKQDILFSFLQCPYLQESFNKGIIYNHHLTSSICFLKDRDPCRPTLLWKMRGDQFILQDFCSLSLFCCLVLGFFKSWPQGGEQA